MSTVFLSDIAINTRRNLPKNGDTAPDDFMLMKDNFVTLSLNDFQTKKIVFISYPSIDTSVTVDLLHKVNEISKKYQDTVFICVSIDLPFTLSRVKKLIFANKTLSDNLLLASDYKNRRFGDLYGLTMVDGPVSGMLSSAVLILDYEHKIAYSQISHDISKSIDTNLLDNNLLQIEQKQNSNQII